MAAPKVSLLGGGSSTTRTRPPGPTRTKESASSSPERPKIRARTPASMSSTRIRWRAISGSSLSSPNWVPTTAVLPSDSAKARPWVRRASSSAAIRLCRY